MNPVRNLAGNNNKISNGVNPVRCSSSAGVIRNIFTPLEFQRTLSIGVNLNIIKTKMYENF